jgi:hypothetical protein
MSVKTAWSLRVVGEHSLIEVLTAGCENAKPTFNIGVRLSSLINVYSICNTVDVGIKVFRAGKDINVDYRWV